jgi:capsid protein
VDPAKEIDANTKAVELGVTSRTRIAAEQGDDFEDVLDELTQEDALLSAAGLKTGAAKVVTSSGGLDGLEPGQGSDEDD